MTVHFTSDLHLGHEKVARLRGFSSTAAHDEHLVREWETAVHPEDIVYVLGDLAASAPHYALDTLAGLPGVKRLVSGNHDRTHPMHRDSWRWQGHYLRVFQGVAQSARIRVMGAEVLLSHFPYERDRAEPRYLQWRLRDEGLPLLHGHTHGTERLSVEEAWTFTLPSGRISDRDRIEVHVGVDAWNLAPVSDAAVAALLAGAV